MRKLIVFIHSTLNGIVTGDPSEDRTNFMVWTTPHSLETGSDHLIKTLETVDTVLLGRATYQDLKRKWPFVAEWPGVDDLALKLGEMVNATTKLVVTNQSSEALEWGAFARPKRITGTDTGDQIKTLKVKDGVSVRRTPSRQGRPLVLLG